MDKQYCKVSRTVKSKNNLSIKKGGCAGICKPVAIIGHPSEYCEYCNKSN